MLTFHEIRLAQKLLGKAPPTWHAVY